MAQFKDEIDEGVARFYGDGLAAVVPGFDGEAFVAEVVAGLDALELKDRVRLIARLLHAHLGSDIPAAIEALLGLLQDGPGLAFAHWPMAQFVEDYGVEHFDVSVAAMEQITKRFSCEFAVRPFLVRYPDRMLEVMHRWARHPDVHVRRTASEGIRPRLPWGMRLTAYIEDPTPVFGVLEVLRHDPEEYVRRSVSNCLNDIAKDHPERLMDVLERWDEEAGPHTEWIKGRALRTLVKAGAPRALRLLGYGPPKVRIEGLATDAPSYRVGDTMTLSFAIVSTSAEPQRILVDYRVHFVKASGARRPKVFKLATRTLDPGGRIEVVRRQHLRPISTRRYHAGVHAVDVQVNGVAFDAVEFALELAE